MVNMLRYELNKIVDVYNNRLIKFIFKYGVIKAEIVQIVLSLLFLLLGSSSEVMIDNLKNIGIRILITIIPGIIWGFIEYINYKDVIDEKKTYTIKSGLYLILYGILGWGTICAVSNITFVPLNENSILASLIAMPIYGLVIGLISRKSFNHKLVRQLYTEHIKGKNIKKVQLNKKTLKMGKAK